MDEKRSTGSGRKVNWRSPSRIFQSPGSQFAPPRARRRWPPSVIFRWARQRRRRHEQPLVLEKTAADQADHSGEDLPYDHIVTLLHRVDEAVFGCHLNLKPGDRPSQTRPQVGPWRWLPKSTGTLMRRPAPRSRQSTSDGFRSPRRYRSVALCVWD